MADPAASSSVMAVMLRSLNCPSPHTDQHAGMPLTPSPAAHLEECLAAIGTGAWHPRGILEHTLTGV